jgi:asparagine N-glycosylation enzyme membrane subunit Stt3
MPEVKQPVWSIEELTTFPDKVRAVVWAIVLLIVVGFALYYLYLWEWRAVICMVWACAMALLAPGRRVVK